MKSLKSILLLCGILALPLKAEERYFRFQNPGKTEISRITKLISIDNVKDGWVYAYANDKGWERFLRLGYSAEPLPHPGSLNVETCSPGFREVAAWNAYPSHTAYLDMMQNFQKSYPNLCEVSSIGKSGGGRPLMVAKLSSNVSQAGNKPKFFYSSTMHGDETTGYVLMLRLIDYLLTNYNQSTPDGVRATNILNNMEIWINPLANPDGTYRSGDSSIKNPTRGNAAGVDLNRNYPDIQSGDHPDGESWQPETTAMMQLAKQAHFVMAANMHGGAEVANYPWDTMSARHVDDAWWQAVCRRYADNVHASGPSGYFTDLNNGVTNGYDWYEVNGSRQDYTNFNFGCREMTLELSATKFLPASQLPAYWDYNKNALLTCMEESLKGIRGIVSDAQTGVPLASTVSLKASNEMPVNSDPKTGAFFRVTLPGTYTITIIADGYQTKTVSDISVINGPATALEVKLQSNQPSGVPKANFTFTQNTANAVTFTDASTCSASVINAWAWDFGDGTTSKDKNPFHTFAQSGTFNVKLTVTTENAKTDTITKAVQVSSSIAYCTSKSSNTSYFHINKVSVGTFSNASSASTYSDFTAKVIEMTPGTPYKLQIGCGNKTTYRNIYTVWVDLNRNGDFSDTGEQLYTSGTGITGGASGTLTIPTGTPAGKTRMRVIQKNGNTVQPCESFTYGEVEDYTVNISN